MSFVHVGVTGILDLNTVVQDELELEHCAGAGADPRRLLGIGVVGVSGLPKGLRHVGWIRDFTSVERVLLRHKQRRN